MATQEIGQIGDTRRQRQYIIVNGPQTWTFIRAYFAEEYTETTEIPFEVQRGHGEAIEKLKVRIHFSGRRSNNSWVFVGAADFPEGVRSTVTKFFKITYTFKSPRKGVMQELPAKLQAEITDFFWGS